MHGKCGPCRAWMKLAPGTITQADYRILRASKPESGSQDQSQCFVSAIELHHAGSDAVDFRKGGYVSVECNDKHCTWDFHTREEFQGLHECWTGGVYLDSSGHAVVVLSDAADRPYGPAYADGGVPRPATERMMHEGDRLQIVQQAGLSEGTTRVPMKLVLNKLVFGQAVEVDLKVGPDMQYVEVLWGPDMQGTITGLHMQLHDCGYSWDANNKTLVKLVNHFEVPPYPRNKDLRIVESAEHVRALQEQQGGAFTITADGTAPPTVKVLAHDGDTTEEMIDRDDGGSISAQMRDNDAGHAAKEEQPDIMANHPGNTVGYANGNGDINHAAKYGAGTSTLKVYALNPEGTHRVNALWLDALSYGRLSPSAPRFMVCDEVYEPLQGSKRCTAIKLLELVGSTKDKGALECVCLAEDFVYLAVLYAAGTPITVLLRQRTKSRSAQPRAGGEHDGAETDGTDGEDEPELHELTKPLGPAQPAYSYEQAQAKAFRDLQTDLGHHGVPFVREDWVIKTNLRKDMRWEHKHIYQGIFFKSRLKALQHICDKHNLNTNVSKVTRSRTIQPPPKVPKRPKPPKEDGDADDEGKKKSRKQKDPKSSMDLHDYVEAALAAPRANNRPARRAAVAGVAAATAAVRFSGATEEAPDERDIWEASHPDYIRKQPVAARMSATEPMQVEDPYGSQAYYQGDEEDDYQYGNEYDEVLAPSAGPGAGNMPGSSAFGNGTYTTGRPPAAPRSGMGLDLRNGGAGSAQTTYAAQQRPATLTARPVVRGPPLVNGQAAHKPTGYAAGPNLPAGPSRPAAPLPSPVPSPASAPAAAPAHEEVSWQTLRQMLPEIKDVQETADGNVVLTYDMRQRAFPAVCSILRSLGKAEAADALFLKWRRHYSSSPAGSKEFLDAYIMLQAAAECGESAMLSVLKEDFQLPL